MLKLQFPQKVKFVCGFIFSDEEVYSRVKRVLCRKFGPLDFESGPIRFEFTDYYCAEMGSDLTKRLVSFRRVKDAGDFAGIKRFCMNLEKRYAHQGKRTVNIDPGYLNEAHLVLTTTKDFYHRIYLGKGIHAEVTVYYKNRRFEDLPWTYPDFRTPAYKAILADIRAKYVAQIKGVKGHIDT